MASELKPFGYAPGSYMNNCKSCGQSFMGDKRAWNCEPCAKALSLQADTRPAPAATDTGLKTIGFVPPMFVEGKGADYNDIFRRVSIAENYTAVVTRSQAVELLAAERAENTRLQSENDAQADQISELQMTPWPEWATKVLAVIRKRSGYDGYGDAIEGVDLPAELDECIAAIEADNAALTARVTELEDMLLKRQKRYERRTVELEAKIAAKDARIKELEQINAMIMGDDENAPRYTTKRLKQEIARATEALEAKLAAAEEVAQLVIQAEEDKSGDPNFYILLMQTAYDKARAVLGGKP